MRSIDIGQSTRPERVEAGSAPMLQWIKVADLVVDDDYQRDLKKENWTRIRRIAENFRWSRFSTVLVSPVEGGRYAIIDGQHRTHAAALCSIEAVPCQVVQMTREEQAASFAAVNGLVTKVTGWNILKAAIVAGESWAVECAAACAEAGCVLMTRGGATDDKKPGEIYTVGLVRKAIRDGHRAALTWVLKGIRRAPLRLSGNYQAYSVDCLKPLLMAAIERPLLVKEDRDLAQFFVVFDVMKAISNADETMKRQRRAGMNGVSRFALACDAIVEGFDRFFTESERAAEAEPSREDDEAELEALEAEEEQTEDPAVADPGEPADPAEDPEPDEEDDGVTGRFDPATRFYLRHPGGERLHEGEHCLTRMSRFFWRGTAAEVRALRRKKPQWRQLKPEPVT